MDFIPPYNPVDPDARLFTMEEMLELMKSLGSAMSFYEGTSVMLGSTKAQDIYKLNHDYVDGGTIKITGEQFMAKNIYHGIAIWLCSVIQTHFDEENLKVLLGSRARVNEMTKALAWLMGVIMPEEEARREFQEIISSIAPPNSHLN